MDNLIKRHDLNSDELKVYGYLLVFALIAMLPNWVAISNDEEGFLVEMISTYHHATSLMEGTFPFWNPNLGFGVPHPLSQSLTLHPFMPLFALLPLQFVIPAVSQVHYLVLLTGMYTLSRYLGISRMLSFFSAVTIGLLPPSINYFWADFWPVAEVYWCLLIWQHYFLLRTIDTAKNRYAFALCLGVTSGIMFVSGHAGLFPVSILGCTLLLIGRRGRSFYKAFMPLLLASLVCLLIGCPKALRLASELSTFPKTDVRSQMILPFDAVRLVAYPLVLGDYLNSYRNTAIGPILFFLFLLSFKVSPHKSSTRGFGFAAIACLILLLLPPKWMIVLSSVTFIRDLISIYIVLIAFNLLQHFVPDKKNLVYLVVLTNTILLFWGASYFWCELLKSGMDYFRHKDRSLSVRQILDDKPLYAALAQLDGNERVVISPKLFDVLIRSRKHTHFFGFAKRKVRVIQGEFRGVDLHSIHPNDFLMHGAIRNSSFIQNKATLNVLGIGYVVAASDEQLPELRKVASAGIADEYEICIYANRDRWPEIAMLNESAFSESLPDLPGAHPKGILWKDYRELERHHIKEKMQIAWKSPQEVQAQFNSSDKKRKLLFTQMYRSGWEYSFDGVKWLKPTAALSAFIGCDVPPGVKSISFRYHPTFEIFATISAYFALSVSTFLVVFSFARRAGSQSTVSS